MLFDSISSDSNLDFVRGYALEIVSGRPELKTRVQAALNAMESRQPEAAFLISFYVGDYSDALMRAKRLIDTEKIPWTYLRAFGRRFSASALDTNEIAEIAKRLATRAFAGEKAGISGLLELLHACLTESDTDRQRETIENSTIGPILWRVLDFHTELSSHDVYNWKVVLEISGGVDISRAMRCAVFALASDSFHIREAAAKYLASRAGNNHFELLNALAELIEDEGKAWRLHISDFKGVIENLPIDALRAWLEREGSKGAVHIARQLPNPYIDDTGSPIVPAITSLVLETFDSSDEVFGEFFAGTLEREHWGSISAAFRAEGEIASRFLGHPLRRVREWAQKTMKFSADESNYWREREEEREIH